jgi:outer membrane protein OmpA-like peptidoglycan-associated protein
MEFARSHCFKYCYAMKIKTLAALLVAALSAHFLIAQDLGLEGNYYDGKNFDKWVFSRIDSKLDFDWDNVAPAKGMNPQEFSIKWRGQIKAPQTGEYMFRALVDDGLRVRVGGQTVINGWGMNDSEKFMGYITLTEGQLYTLEVDYFNGLFEGEIHLRWQLPDDAPLFGGAMGYNDKPIDSKYYYKPATSTQQPNAPKPKKEPAAKPAATKPPTKPQTKAKPAKPAETKPAAVPKDSIERFTPKNILFQKSKDIMLSGSNDELDRLAGFLARHPKLKLTIEGHTDNVGNADKNLELSQRRARAVRDYLVGKGVATDRITAIGYGDTRPLVKSDKGNEQNRRVVFLIE